MYHKWMSHCASGQPDVGEQYRMANRTKIYYVRHLDFRVRTGVSYSVALAHAIWHCIML